MKFIVNYWKDVIDRYFIDPNTEEYKKTKKIMQYLEEKIIFIRDIGDTVFDINNITKRIIPTKVLEYMACGKPVITTPLLGIKEFFPDESCGVSYSSTETFHESVIALLSNKNKMAEMAKEGSKYVKDTLNWDTIADLLLEKFTMLVKEKKFNN